MSFFYSIKRNAAVVLLSSILLVLSFTTYAAFDEPDSWLLLYSLDLVSILAAGAAAPFIGVHGVVSLCGVTGLAFTASLVLNFSRFFVRGEIAMLDLGPLFKLPGVSHGTVLYIDNISYGFALLTALISSCVFFYAFSYMRFEKNIVNFLILLKMFGWSMTLLVLSGSWVTFFLGWELIGITSFLLINFWSSKVTTLKSAIKALSFNKVSDAAIMCALCLNISSGTLYFNGSAAYSNLLASKEFSLGFATIDYASLLLLCLMIASFCKSAQFGFHFWLPDSMEAPVPASALIHSATLVSAGIYTMLRFNTLFLTSPSLGALFAAVTAFTAFFGALIAAFQTDVKKVLAYSTISHCGMLMFSVLMHLPYVTIFYLFAHGFFKSLNFMCVGNFIQHSNNYQDVSRMGRFSTALAYERSVFAATLFNLSSAPMFFCFFSKHWLVTSAFTNSALDLLIVVFIYGAAFSGFFYSSKLMYECLLSVKRAHSSVYSVYAMGSSSSLYRRVNAAGRLSILALTIVSFICLYFMWVLAADQMQIFADDYNASVAASLGYSNYLTGVLFSVALFVLACSYLFYKRNVANPLLTAAIAIIAIIIFTL